MADSAVPPNPDCWCPEFDGTAHYECYEHSPACICGADDYTSCWVKTLAEVTPRG